MGPLTETAGPDYRWRFLVSPRWLGWHAFAVVAFWGMCWLGDWQLHRALAGNSLSWAYTFEWPLFAIMGAFFWGKTIRDELHLRSATDSATDIETTEAAGGCLSDAARTADRDPAVYAAYVARLNEQVRGHGRWHGFR